MSTNKMIGITFGQAVKKLERLVEASPQRADQSISSLRYGHNDGVDWFFVECFDHLVLDLNGSTPRKLLQAAKDAEHSEADAA